MLAKERNTMMNLGRWETTTTAVYASDAVVIHNGNKDARTAFDYREVNLRMAWDPYPFPSMWDVLQWLVAVPFRFVSGGDANKGFYQIWIKDPKIRDWLAIRLPDGIYHPKYMPFGPKTAPSHYCRMMDDM